MAFALLGLRAPGIRIADPGCVAKTFPGLLGDARRAASRRWRPATRVPRLVRVIAIDGPAGSGKSTVARALAAPPRASSTSTPGPCTGRSPSPRCAAAIDPAEQDQVARHGRRPRARGRRPTRVVVDGVDATIEIRGPEVSRAVSIVAANPDGAGRDGAPPAGVGGRARRRRARGARHRHGGVPRRRAQGVPHRRSRGAGPAPVQGGHATSTTRRWPPTWPAATPSTRAGRSSPADGGARRLRGRHHRPGRRARSSTSSPIGWPLGG